jgi:histidine triad (HIT) family protein
MSALNSDPSCIFCKIVAGQIPSRKVFEDEQLLAFHDIQPWAPVHVLIIPKQHIESLAEVGPEHQELVGRMLVLAPRLMRELGVTHGFRTLINTGRDGMQEVMHLHMHVIGGPRPWAKG